MKLCPFAGDFQQRWCDSIPLTPLHQAPRAPRLGLEPVTPASLQWSRDSPSQLSHTTSPTPSNQIRSPCVCPASQGDAMHTLSGMQEPAALQSGTVTLSWELGGRPQQSLHRGSYGPQPASVWPRARLTTTLQNKWIRFHRRNKDIRQRSCFLFQMVSKKLNSNGSIIPPPRMTITVISP